METSTKPAQQKKSNFIPLIIFAVAIILIYQFFIKDDGEEKNTKTETQEVSMPVLSISSTKLAVAYEQNEIDADNLYKDKLIQVNGKIVSIGNDVMDDPYIVLNTGNDFSLTGVQCMLKTKDMASGLRKGELVSVTGKCSGKMMNVILRNCTLEILDNTQQ